MEIALPHGDHALGERRHHRADDFRTRALVRLVEMAAADVEFARGFGRDLETIVRQVDFVR